jgi:prolyl oligopeptidase
MTRRFHALLPVALALLAWACGGSGAPVAVTPEVVTPPGDAGPAAARGDAGPAVEDPYLALEEIGSETSLDWARERNAVTTAELEADPRYAPLRERLLGILDSKDKIPWVTKRGRHYYNFWRDEAHPRGLWRRVRSVAEFRRAEPPWETVLDLDELARAEGENWVWGGAECFYPKYERCLVKLSRGGGDAHVVREFDAVRKRFVEEGFALPEAKSRVAWKDKDTIYVGTDFGPGSLTESGYPRLAKEWKRGTPPAAAETLLECEVTDMYCAAWRDFDHGHVRDFAKRKIAFYEQELFRRRGGELVPVPVPLSSNTATWDDQLLIELRDDWEAGDVTWPKGSLLATPLEGFLAGERELTALFTPSPRRSLRSFAPLRSAVVVLEMEDVRSRATAWTRRGGRWEAVPFDEPKAGTFWIDAVEPNDSDEYWLTASDFDLPSTLSRGRLRGGREPLKRSPAFFDTAGIEVRQHFAVSQDGTEVPYFQVSRRDLVPDGDNPTLLYGYGGFEISLEAAYNAEAGAAWLEAGGVYAVANIRGGGEYGPRWHQAALKGERQRAYDDFIAVAEDLVARQVTRPSRLGITGGSNGGLLMGVMLTQRPDLFCAVVARVPLLDMKRYHRLLAGASWMAEYGDPDVPGEWAALARYSPYQNVRAGVRYPRTLFLSSTRDDRVHPGHARKMTARMLEQGHDVLYYENIEGGHGGAANNEQRARMSALAYVFLARELGLPWPSSCSPGFVSSCVSSCCP